MLYQGRPDGTGRGPGGQDWRGADLTLREDASARRLQNQECRAWWHSASLMVLPLPRARKVARARSLSLTVRSLNREFWRKRAKLRSRRQKYLENHRELHFHVQTSAALLRCPQSLFDSLTFLRASGHSRSSLAVFSALVTGHLPLDGPDTLSRSLLLLRQFPMLP